MEILLAIIFLSIILFAHELGHFLLAKICKVPVEEFGFGFPPRIWAKKIGETEYSFNWLPFGGFNKINEESFDRQPAGRRMLILAGGVLINVILGWVFFVLVFIMGSNSLVLIADVAPGSPAASAGLQKNDEVLSVMYQNEVLNAPFSSQDFIDFVGRYKGKTFTLKINREGQNMDISVGSRVNPPADEGSMGVVIIDAGAAALPFFKSLSEAAKYTGQVIGLSFYSLYWLVRNIFSKPELLGALTGPVGAVALAAQVGKIGFSYLLQIMAFISLGFAAFNILPFPGLDGGHVLFVLIEKIKGSPVPAKIRNSINTFGFGFLLLLMVFIMFKDIKNLL
ncbi:MAG: site-2 protease family protein [Candidatus Paceibacterota bacterium]